MSLIAVPRPALPADVVGDAMVRRGALVAPVGLAIVLVVAAVLMRPLIPVDETRYLSVAWEMRQSQDWLVPHLNGQAYSHKPPMLFWLINLAWAVFGENAFVARLVPAAFLPVSVWLTGRLGGVIGGKAVGDRAALIAVGFLVFVVSGTLVMFDAMLTAACLAGLIGLCLAAQGQRLRGFGLFGLMIGAGLLIKGPATLIHLAPAALLAPLWVDRRQNWAAWYAGVLAAIALGAAIGLAWALPAARASGPEFAHAILWGQTSGRVVNAFDHARPAWYYLALAPVLLLPWSVSRNLWAAVRERNVEPPSRASRLPWIAAAGTVILFSLVSGKQVHYVAPAIPSLAIGLALMLARRPVLPEPGFAVVTFVLGAVLVLIYPLGLLHESWPPYPFALGGLVAMAASVIVWKLRARPATAATAAVVSIFAGLHVSALLGGLSIYDPSWVTPHLASGPDRRQIAIVGEYAGEYGYAARLDRPVTVLAPEAAPGWLTSHPDGVVIQAWRDQPALDGPAVELRPYRKGMLGVWTAESSLQTEPRDAPASR